MLTRLLIPLATYALISPAFAACGEKGGPGYRGPNGKCVGWAQLGQVCGSPPTTKCAAELTANGAVEAATAGTRIEQLRQQASPSRPN